MATKYIPMGAGPLFLHVINPIEEAETTQRILGKKRPKPEPEPRRNDDDEVLMIVSALEDI